MGTPLSWQFTPEILATHVLPRGGQGAKETHKVRRDSVEQASFDLQMLARFEVPTNTWDRAIQTTPLLPTPQPLLTLQKTRHSWIGQDAEPEGVLDHCSGTLGLEVLEPQIARLL
jgi:hypothetical protein